VNLTHLDKNDRPKMVDVGEKSPTKRVATASGTISMDPGADPDVPSASA